jgi:hypothetical protein
MGVLYKTTDQHCFTSRELAAAKVASFPADAPDHPVSPEGEWYCQNTDCAVRECKITCRLHPGEAGMPATFGCPGCGQQMSFHHWIGHETLIPMTTEVN